MTLDVYSIWYLLPKRIEYSSEFNPLQYGRGGTDFSIDHIIPQAAPIETQEGMYEADRLTNFAPIGRSINSEAKNLPASAKLGPQGLYEDDTSNNHPYEDG